MIGGRLLLSLFLATAPLLAGHRGSQAEPPPRTDQYPPAAMSATSSQELRAELLGALPAVTQGPVLLPSGSAEAATTPSKLDLDPRFRARLTAAFEQTREASSDDVLARAWPRIIGGIADTLNNEVVLVTTRAGDCSGVLVGSRAVLTAAHCLCRGQTNRTAEPRHAIFVIDGRRLPPIRIDGLVSLQRGEATRIGCPARPSKRDIALLRLHEPAPVSPLSFPSAENYDEMLQRAPDIVISGYGMTDALNRRSSGQRFLVKTLVASPDCGGEVDEIGRPDRLHYGCNPELEFVAGEVGSARGTCLGDSGAPALVIDSSRRRWVIGINSRSVSGGSCGDGSVFVRTDGRVTEWIDGWLEAWRGH
jgi:hypothetical protein